MTISNFGLEESKELFQDFASEIFNCLDTVETEMIRLAQNDPSLDTKETINTAFRFLHSMKGSSGFLDLNTIQKIGHAAESRLQFFRDHPDSWNSSYAEVFTKCFDLVRTLTEHVKINFNDKGFEEEAESLIKLLEGKSSEPSEKSEPGEAEPIFDLPEAPAEINRVKTLSESKNDFKENSSEKEEIALIWTTFLQSSEELLAEAEEIILSLENFNKPDSVESVKAVLRTFHTIKGNAGCLNLNSVEASTHLAESIISEIKDSGGSFTPDVRTRLLTIIDNILIEIRTASAKQIESPVVLEKEKTDTVRASLPAKPEREQPYSSVPQAQDIRVSISKLDQLIDLVGELVISEAMISQDPALLNSGFENLKSVSAQLNRNIRSLQEIAMSMRMVPVANTFRKMIRLVHDVSRKLKKEIDLQILGEDTEMDKTLVELVSDPLVHILRNAIDHGLELPHEREKIGKPRKGKIILEACHVGGEIWITISDDGRGLNREKILKTAIKKGLVQEGSTLTDEEVWLNIFEPGFSTNDVVTDFSGRGVGMDVVKKNITKLHGRIDIASAQNKGTKLTLRIPLTLTIIDSLLVKLGETFYALPTSTIIETLRPQEKMVFKTMDHSEMVKIREHLLPVIRLHTLFNHPVNGTPLSAGMLLVIEQDEKRFCIFVDSIKGQQQIVVKPLPKSMNHVNHLSGSTILGDGQVGLILDAASLARIVDMKNAVRQKTK